MKRKFLSFLLSSVLVVGSLVLSACDSGKDSHTHSYSSTDIASTCTQQGYKLYSCSCGNEYRDNYENALGHDFKDYVSDNNATVDSDGTKTSICSREGCSTTDTITDVGSKLVASYSPSEIYKMVNPSVVYISITTSEGISAGSGFFINDTGRVVTNYHVISKGISGKVTDSLGNTFDVTKIVGYSSSLDIAILDTTCAKSTAVKLQKSKIETGAAVYAIGYPQSFIIGSSSSTFTEGMVSNNALTFLGNTYIQTSTPITNGNSGGALINDRGEVVGITTAKINIEGVDYFNLAIPVSIVDIVNTSTPKTFAEVFKENPILPTSISLDRAEYEIYKDVTFQIISTIYPSDADDKSVTWVSSNPEVATVSNGVVTGISHGTAIITATTCNGKVATATIIVSRRIEYLTIDLTLDNCLEYLEVTYELVNTSYTAIRATSKYPDLIFKDLEIKIEVKIQGARYYPDQSVNGMEMTFNLTHNGLGYMSHRTTNGWFDGYNITSCVITSVSGTISGYFYVD